jgi:D-alanyl-D-alanine carboxypeptidase
MSYNKLVGRYSGADGMKTGFVCASGFNMIGSATRDGRTLVAVVLGEKSATARTEVVASLLDRGFQAKGTQNVTLTSLPPYGVSNAAPVDMREEVCSTKPAAAQSEAADEHEAKDGKKGKSPWLEKIPNPKLVTVALGGATGPVPLAWHDQDVEEIADVPIPTPRPDYPPAAKAAAQGDAVSN